MTVSHTIEIAFRGEITVLLSIQMAVKILI